MKIIDLFPDLADKLRAGPMSTKEVEDYLFEHYRYRCPDDLTKSMNMLRQVGEVNGKVSVEHGGWIWWIDKPDEKD